MGVRTDTEERVLVVVPVSRDEGRALRILASSGIRTETCADVATLCRELERGAGAALVAEEALSPVATEKLGQALSRQPAWSDVPIIVLAGARSVSAASHLLAAHLSTLGNVSLLTRPLRHIPLVSAVRGALRARGRQYELRAHIGHREAEVQQRDQFLAILGHELRNPLAAIRLAAELMERQPDSVDRHRGLIERQAHHLSRLVDDLLDVARVTSDKMRLQLEPLVLAEVVRRALQALEVQSRGRNVEVDLAAGEGLVIDGDPVRLEQVAANLLTNAFKYTPEGGTVRVTLARDGNDATLTIADSGVGMDPDQLAQVFDLFFQADHTLDRARGGMGIGLTLVRRLVALHGGSVQAESAGLGNGSSFSVRLPLASVERPEQREFSFQIVAAPRSIGIVEDNADFREALLAGLGALGHDVTGACDGPAGVAMLLARQPEVAIVDIGLPGLDGYGVARRLRDAMGGGILLIALTGYGQPEDRRRALEAGFDVHLTKPLDLDALQSVLSYGPTSLQATG